ncbi:hypothetical protein N9414_10643, partial [Nodularia spumigena CCY9414]
LQIYLKNQGMKHLIKKLGSKLASLKVRDITFN